MRVLIITPNGTRETTELAGPVSTMLEQVQQLVGGFITALGGRDGWAAYVNEDGQQLQLPLNPLATTLAVALGWRFLEGDALFGVAVFFGRRPGSSTESDVPARVTQLAEMVAERMEQITREQS